jgi:hypothetical protein
VLFAGYLVRLLGVSFALGGNETGDVAIGKLGRVVIAVLVVMITV